MNEQEFYRRDDRALQRAFRLRPRRGVGHRAALSRAGGRARGLFRAARRGRAAVRPADREGRGARRPRRAAGDFPQAAAHAAGELTFTRAPGTAGEVPIPAGTACAAPDGRVYLTTDAGSIPAGETSATLAARAALAGRGGNAARGQRHAAAPASRRESRRWRTARPLPAGRTRRGTIRCAAACSPPGPAPRTA